MTRSRSGTETRRSIGAVQDSALADLSRLHAVVPLRSLTWGKARLGDAVDGEEREALLLGMLLHLLGTLRDWPACEAVHLVSPDARVLAAGRDSGAAPVLQASIGLNDAIELGRGAATQAGATAILVVPADLPLLESSSLDRLLDAADAAVAAGAGRPVVVVAPSDARGGTNALLLSPPDAIEPCFGANSLEAHVRAAAAAAASLQLVVDPGLGFDLDTPEDLERLPADRLRVLLALGIGVPATAVDAPPVASPAAGR